MWASIGRFILEFIFAKIVALISAAVAKLLRRKKIDEESSESVDKLKKAKTGEEIDEASDDALNGL